MGSRRLRRAHGRSSSSLSANRPKPSIGKVKAVKQNCRHQLKAMLLAAARNARRSQQLRSPLLITFLPVCDMPSSQLEVVANTLMEAPRDKNLQCFETLTLPRDLNSQNDLLIAALDAAKVTDILILVFNNRASIDDVAIDLIDAIRAQGLPSVYAIASGDGNDDIELRKFRSRQLSAESLGDEHALRPIPIVIDGSKAGLEANRVVLRRILSKSPREVAWRSRYGYFNVDEVRSGSPPNAPKIPATISLMGWIRGRGLSANELLHISGVGSFIVKRIIDGNGTVISQRIDENADPLESVAEVDEMMGEQTWPPEMEDHIEEEEDAVNEAEDISATSGLERLGTSAIHADEAEFDESVDKLEGETKTTESGRSQGIDEGDDMSVDEDEVQRVRGAAKADMEFPDEVDTPVDRPARVRFARYRGLKSLRTGEWDPKEQLPQDYGSVFQFRDLPATRKRVLTNATADASKSENFACSGMRAYVEIEDLTGTALSKIEHILKVRRLPVVACGLLKNENRRSVVHFALKRSESIPEDAVIKAKMPLELHCGFVRFMGRPMFSEHNANTDKHKMERFLVPGRWTVASFYGPAIYAPAPALLSYVNGRVLATGNALGADPDRIILKRIILTGYPFKTQKKKAVVKYMFFNPEDVRWFKPVELWTKLGRTGSILEPLGTHGLMKCVFDSAVLHHDTICMTLYKRVYPKLLD